LDDEYTEKEVVADQKARGDFLDSGPAIVRLEPGVFCLLGGDADAFHYPQDMERDSREERCRGTM
jgi:hypothetical protein